NNLRIEGTFMTVDQQVSGGWETVRTDLHDFTIFEWKRDNLVLGYSTTTLSWYVPHSPFAWFLLIIPFPSSGRSRMARLVR
ncbi:hypothetical protein BOTBODRAFT_119012, partial [Botryobasidium botryosum FD-172 SS1]